MSAYAQIDDSVLTYAEFLSNEEFQEIFSDYCFFQDRGGDIRLYCEDITPRFGSRIGQETIDTAKWIGRFQNECKHFGLELILISRNAYTDKLKCKKSSKFHKRPSMDTQVRHAMEERWGKGCLDSVPAKMIVNGKEKKNIRSHVFQALGLATVMHDLICEDSGREGQ